MKTPDNFKINQQNFKMMQNETLKKQSAK